MKNVGLYKPGSYVVVNVKHCEVLVVFQGLLDGISFES
jgi:hypothetical protein